MLELGMRALAIQRWLWGLLLLGLLVVPGRGLGRGLAKTPPSAPPAAPSVAPEVLVAPFTAPAAMPALGAELARALHAALREANIPARLVKGDESGALSGRLEEISQAQVRLSASYHGHTAQSVGDLEHLDDLVYAVFTQLRPRLQAMADPAGTRSGAVPAGPRDALATAGPPSPGSTSAPGSSAALSAGTSAAGAPSTAASSAATAAKDSPPGSGSASDRGTASKDPGRTGAGQRAAEAHPLASGKKSTPIITASLSAGTASAAGKDDGKGGKDGSKDGSKGGNKDGSKDGNKDDGKGGKDDGKASADTVATLTPARPPEGPGTVPGSSVDAPPAASSYPSLPKTPPPPLPRPPVAPTNPYPAYADPRRPRVAVHVVGEPLVRVPPGFYGLGAVGQQTLMSYLQQRWRVPAVGSRLVGLTGGLAALDHSLRLGARHTLMARLDSLVLSASPTAGGGPGLVGGGNAGPSGLAGPGGPGGPGAIGGTLSGRLHVVLLLDGKLLLDRSITMPPTLVLSSETPAQAYSRILFVALDSVAGELYARLVQPPPG